MMNKTTVTKGLLSLALLTSVYTRAEEFLFSSESVTEGHPDKLCDQISDAVLDAYLAKDPNARVACESMAAKNVIMVTGEITSKADVNITDVVRGVIKEIGYTDVAYGLDADSCTMLVSMSKQSGDIAMGVDEGEKHEQGAGDQGLMFGYACDETPELMPLPIMLAHKLTQRLTQLRKDGTLPWLRPDGKSQVTLKYVDGRPVAITTVVISTQHDPSISLKDIEREIKAQVIKPVCKDYLTEDTRYFINPTGNFVLGGPAADAGLTGRKIIVDTYGGMGRHGGGCFSGKDPSKVDRSAAYMARNIAKTIVAAKAATRCEVQIAYSIGIAEPVSLYVNTFGTAVVSERDIEQAVRAIFGLKPAEIIEYLQLRRPVYGKTAAYGHFGREEDGFSWEKTPKVDELRAKLGL